MFVYDFYMQTFVPFSDVYESARVLDLKRLGKQRVETLQIVLGVLRINLDGTPKTGRTWGDHTVGKMWAKNLHGLLVYQDAIVSEWREHSFKDTCWVKTKVAMHRAGVLHPDIDPLSTDMLPVWVQQEHPMPDWWGREDIHSSHRAALLSKNPEYYGQFGWKEAPVYNYVWPI